MNLHDSLHHLYFGRELRPPYDLVFDTTTTVYYETGAHLLSQTRESIRDTYDLVRANGISAMQRQKLAYDKKRGFHTTYEVGDKVLVWKPLPPTVTDFRKFRTRFSGPWRVEKVLSDWTYQLKNDATSKVIVTHFDSLRKIPTSLRTQAADNSPVAPIAPADPTNIEIRSEEDDEDEGLEDLFYSSEILTKNAEQETATNANRDSPIPLADEVSAHGDNESIPQVDDSFTSAVDELEFDDEELITRGSGHYNLRGNVQAPDRYSA